MTEGNKMFTKIVFITAVILTAFFIFTRLPAIGDGKAQDNSGVPDVVSSRTQNDDCYLTVVANSESINEQKAFCRESNSYVPGKCVSYNKIFNGQR